MKRTDAWLSQNRSSDSTERSNSVSHLQAAESLPTLRDQFAMSALQGILANQGYYIEPADELSRHAYRLADAMLEARK